MANLNTSAVLVIAILGSGFLIYLPVLVVSYARAQIGLEALTTPRAASVFEKLPGYAKRATWAHQNALEAFPLFAAGALLALVTRVDSPWAATAAWAFLGFRLLHAVFYIANNLPGRSLTFMFGSLCTLTLMGLSLQQALSGSF